MDEISTIMEILKHITVAHCQQGNSISNQGSDHPKDWKDQPSTDKASSKEGIPQQTTTELPEAVLNNTR